MNPYFQNNFPLYQPTLLSSNYYLNTCRKHRLCFCLLIHRDICQVKPLLLNSVIIDREAREIMYLVASVRLSVCPSVRLRSHGWTICRVQQRVKRSHYQSVEFVCVSNSRADAVDWLLIFISVLSLPSLKEERETYKSFLPWTVPSLGLECRLVPDTE